MTFFQIFFSSTGRLARMPYFLYSILLVGIFGLVMGAGVVMFADPNSSGIVKALGVVLMLVTTISYVVGITMLTIKRLHDLGFGGAHVLWYVGLQIASVLAASEKSSIGILFTVASILFSLWVLFAPGEAGDNRFGRRDGGNATPIAPNYGAAA
jgi:uncharacterized membrane protein YhaH (DUF805 family)